jgi:competence protein ComEA
MSKFRSLFALLIASAALFGGPQAGAEPVNINTADATTLASELVGIGATRAAAIVAHRTQNGPFRSVEELTLVKGIGPRVLEQNRGNLSVGPVRPAARPANAAGSRNVTAPAARPAPPRPAAPAR